MTLFVLHTYEDLPCKFGYLLQSVVCVISRTAKRNIFWYFCRLSLMMHAFEGAVQGTYVRAAVPKNVLTFYIN